ncbi:hypothetical protein, partial [Hallella colorans]|uniref:hypothetical protein n=1 Tax=Hallella colorans TaxID=1703337 RepID=UPI0023F06A59
FGGLFSIMEQFDSTLSSVLPQVTLWGKGIYCRPQAGVPVQIICKISNERMCTRNKDVQGFSCGFEDKIKPFGTIFKNAII